MVQAAKGQTLGKKKTTLRIKPGKSAIPGNRPPSQGLKIVYP